MQLKIYQQNAIQELLETTKRLLDYDNQNLVFKSPTGSGKTIMVAEFLKQLVENPEVKYPLSFIWTVPRPILTSQSKEKLENYFEESRALRCSFFEDLDDRKIDENEILFFNWESINKRNAIYIRENEQENNLSKIIERTKEEGREIILIIDESHHHATSDISQKLIRDIGPKLTVEVSATPVLKNPDEIVPVHLEDVKAEGMIKKAVLLNPDFGNIIKGKKIESELSGDSEGIVIDVALKKRRELLNQYQKEKTQINPLVLIQLPDRKTSLEDVIKEKVIGVLKDKYNITIENGKLAIRLSGQHENLENIAKPDNEVEVIIFKHSLALGWDCPRAQILVLFRDWKSLIFSIQTVGRIMRMPEPDHGHYDIENLNNGYVYTNLDNIEIKEDISKGYITVYASERRKDYQPIDLLSCYSVRHREKSRLSLLFIKTFLKEAKRYGLRKKIDIKKQNVNLKLISDWKSEDIDSLAGEKIIGDKKIIASEFDLQRLFDFFVRQNLTPFYPEDRSIGRVKESIYRFFEKEFRIKYEDRQEEIVRAVLSEKNISYFLNVIDRAKKIYLDEVSKRMPELGLDEKWNIPESIPVSGDYIKEDRKKSVLQPFYSDERWKTEKAFIEFLENSKKVEWWFKNGDRDATFFAVPYSNGEKKPFYVDFIVKLKDGRIGLFDTKAGWTQKIAGPKMDGLYQYLKKESRRSKKLFGGITTNTDQKKYQGRWVYFDQKSRKLKENNFNNWKSLEI